MRGRLPEALNSFSLLYRDEFSRRQLKNQRRPERRRVDTKLAPQAGFSF